MNSVIICPSREELNARVADAIVREAESAIAARGQFCIALSGGETPRAIYQYLAQHHQSGIEWRRVHVFFGDERTVAPTHKDSNFAMARDALLTKVGLRPDHIHRIEGEDQSAVAAAARYESDIVSTVASVEGRPSFDLVLLGVGMDGHIASLFPGTDILAERERLVSAVYVPKLQTWRISMTYPLLNNARRVFIIAPGENKAAVVADVLDEKPGIQYPVQGIACRGGETWFLDRAAAVNLRGR